MARIEHLLNRYGSMTKELLDLVAADPALGEPIAAAEDHLRAEMVYAASHEGARHLDDVLTRRTRISIETFDRGTRSARECAELMATVLGWDKEQVEKAEHYEKRVEAEREWQMSRTTRRRTRCGWARRTQCPCSSRGSRGTRGGVAAGPGAEPRARPGAVTPGRAGAVRPPWPRAPPSPRPVAPTR